MKKLLKSCKIGFISIWILVFLVACGKSAPSSVSDKYTHDTNVGLKKKRSADLMDILSNMLLDHSGGLGSEWPNYGNIFDNDYPMDDLMANEIPQTDYDNHFIDYNDRYIGNIDFSENVDLNPPDSLDYSCSEEENNDVVPFVESGYQYNRHPVNSNWNDRDFVVIKPGVEHTYRHRHDNELEYGTNGGKWNRMPSRGNAEIDEILWNQFGIPGENKPPSVERNSPPVTNAIGKDVKFNIFTCLCGPHQPENESKNNPDDYVVLLLKKDHILGGRNEDNAPRNWFDHTELGTSTTTIAIPSKAEADTTERSTTAAVVSTTLGSVHSGVTMGPADEDDCNKTIATEIPLLSATHTTFVTEVPLSSTTKTMTVSATESSSIITANVPNSTSTTERPSTATNPVQPSTIVFTTTTTRRPSWTKSYIPSSMVTIKTTESPPKFTISEPKVSVSDRPMTTAKITESPSTFTITEPKVAVTESPSAAAGTDQTTQSPPTFTISEPKFYVTERTSITAAGITKTTQSPPTFTISEPKVSVTERPSNTAVGTTEIPAATTKHIQSPSETTHSIPITIVSATTKSPTTFTRPTPTTIKAVTTTEIPHSTTSHIPTRTTDPAPVVVGDSKYIATDGATTKFSKPTAGISTTETISIATVISNIKTTLPPPTVAQTITEMPALRTTQMDNHPTKLERIVQYGQQYSTIPPSDANTDAQTTNTLEDINEEPSTTPNTTSSEELYTYVE